MALPRAPTRPETRRGLVGPFTGRQLAAALVVVVAAAVVLVVATQPLVDVRGPARAGDPRGHAVPDRLARARASGWATAPRARGRRARRPPGAAAATSTATRSASPTCAAGPSGSTSGPAGARRARPRRRRPRHGRRLPGQGLAVVGISVQEATEDDVRAYAEKYGLGLHDRGRPDRRRLPALPGLRPADAVLPRRERDHPLDRPGPGDGGERGRQPGPAGARRAQCHDCRPAGDWPRRVAGARVPSERARVDRARGHRRNGLTTRRIASYGSGCQAKRSRSGTRRPTGCRSSCESTTVQRSSAARANSVALSATRVEREVVEGRDPARVRRPRPHRDVAEERERACPAHAPRSPGGRRCARRSGRGQTPGSSSTSPSAAPCVAPLPRPGAARAGRRRRRSAGCRESAISHSARWATIRARGKARAPVGPEEPAGVVVVEMAHRHDVDASPGRSRPARAPARSARRRGRARPGRARRAARRSRSRRGRGRPASRPAGS